MGSGKKVTVGYRYYMGLHMFLSHGPLDAILEIKSGGRTAWSGTQTKSGRIFIDAANLFGGDKREGGLRGDLDVMMGEVGQMPNDYLAAKQGARQPAYRGLAGLVYRCGMISANNPYVKPWHIKVRRVKKGWDGDALPWHEAKAEVALSNGDIGMNPAHIIYQCITSAAWGMQYGSGQIDDANFRAAADKLYAEGFGLCLEWTMAEGIDKFIQHVIDHIAGVVVEDPATGLIQLRLIRDDYDPNTLPLFDESNVNSVEEFTRPSASELINEIIVKYDSVATGNPASIAVQNLANIAARGAKNSETRAYPGIPTPDLATRVALRDLRAVSTPLAKVRMRVDRAAWKRLPGDAIRFSWSKLGVANLVLRVLRVNTGTLNDGTIEIEAAEDVFGLPAAGYVQQEPIGWTDPNTLPAPATNRVVGEASYYELQQRLTTTELAAVAPDAGYLSIVAARPSSDSIDYTIMTSSGGAGFAEAGIGDFCPTGTVTADVSPADTSITLDGVIDGDLVEPGGFAHIESETIRIDAFDVATGVATIGRGVLDTVAAPHPAGARVYFADGFTDTDNVERVDGETVNVKLLPSTGRGTLDATAAPQDAVVFDQRAYRPYPPGRLTIDGVAYPDTTATSTVAVAWAHRDRTLQNLQGDETGDIGPEPGTTYTVRVLNESGELADETTGIAGTALSVALASLPTNVATIEVISTRGGLESRQAARHTFTIPMSNLWTPEYLAAAARLWLNDASSVTDAGGSAAQWNDISGSGWHATQGTSSARPTVIASGLNSRRVLSFDGANDYMSLGGGALDMARNAPSAWIFAVYNHALDATAVERPIATWSINAGSTRAGLFAALAAAKNTPQGGGRRLDSDSSGWASAGAEYGNAWAMTLTHVDYANRRSTIYMNGAPGIAANTLWAGAGNTSDTSSNNARIGGNSASGSPVTFFHGQIAEILAGTDAPTADEIDKIFGYAAHRWGIAALLPGGHPYKDSPPTTAWTPQNLSSKPSTWFSDASQITDDGTGHASAWNDISGNGWHFSQATAAKRPAIALASLNDRRVLSFDGGDILRTTDAGALDLYRNVPSGWMLGVYRLGVTDPAPTQRAFFWWSRNGSTTSRIAIAAGNSVDPTDAPYCSARRVDANPAYAATSGIARAQEWVIVLGAVDYVNRTVKLHVNGELDAETANAFDTGANTVNTASNGATIGGLDSESAYFQGDIAELISGVALPTQDEIDRLFGYAAHKWGLTGVLPPTHPYKNTPPATISGVDSIWIGAQT